MTPETREHLELNPDLQRQLYRSPGGIQRTKQTSLMQRMKEMEAAFTDYKEREKAWQEYLKTRSI